ncbi:branched-chain amino acid ABC transporter permease [Pseudonocardia sp.]|jgi:branched-chain amino acid transport system permease protein|uniref:branched-chain amino acid ABC transporter permease n=1 Tax=Pseudonocardia sp. TaxID=60912 RepID=UPI002D871E58|nr:branched-chain amino acid ABC transporter permease [Pseudonocardia sp.]
MSTFVLLLATGLGLGALYFLVASGLSLIYGLMGVLNFAHGAFLAAGAYAAWWAAAGGLPGAGGDGWGFVLATAFGVAVGAVIGASVELLLIRPLYRRHIEQVLVTVGLGLVGVALLRGIWGADPLPFPRPEVAAGVTTIGGAAIPNDRFVLLVAAIAVLLGLLALLRFTRIGLIIRAGVENRSMVEALGIDVRRTFTLVFALGGAVAALGGVLGSVYLGSVSPGQGTSLLIFAFIVVVIGGLGSLTGSAVAAVVVGLVQQLANYYTASGVGDLSVVLLLALVLLVRPGGLSGRAAA